MSIRCKLGLHRFDALARRVVSRTEFTETFFEGVECTRCGKQQFHPILSFAFTEAAIPLLPDEKTCRAARARIWRA